MSDPLKPEPSLLCKLGGIVVHVDELLSPHGHPLDKVAIQSSLSDPEVIDWISAMTKMAMLPVKRTNAK